MCGLIGAVAKTPSGFFSKEADTLQQLLYADALRGWDATGVFGISKTNEIDVLKAAVPSAYFTASEEFDAFKKKLIASYKMMVGHNRKATHGEKNSEEAHPFWSNANNIVLVHNGMISNYKDFCKEATVDSQAICNALETSTPQEIFSKLEGSFACIWYNVKEHKLYFIRNDSRPLFFIHTADAIYFASEIGMASWIIGRNNGKVDSSIALVPRTLYSIDLIKTELVVEGVIELEKKVTPPPQYIPSSTTGGRTSGEQTKPQRELLAYYTETDIKHAKDGVTLFKRDASTIFIPSSYETKKDSTIVTGQVINLPVDYVVVSLCVKNDVFDEIDLTRPIYVDIAAVVMELNVCKLYVNNPRLPQPPALDTVSGVTIPEDLYFDDDFPVECDCCTTAVKFKDIEKSEIFFDKGRVCCVICPTCLASPKGELH